MTITLQSPLDMHLHLREGGLLPLTVPLSAAHFAGAVVMPNLVEPIMSIDDLIGYREQITALSRGLKFEPFMTLFYRDYDHSELEQLRDHIIGVKLYPAGVTTNSDDGVQDFDGLDRTLAAMQDLEIPLLVHGESDGFVLDREREFLPVYRRLAENFPDLHIIMEHITTAEAVELLDRYDNLSATVTLHHLMITLDDLLGDLLRPDLFCKPVAKTPRDRQALRDAVFGGHPKIMFGSDSAPHPRHKKECIGCAAGVFSAPVALPLLVQLFEEQECLEHLSGFVCANAVRRYGIEVPVKSVALERAEWVVPELYGDVRPFWAGRTVRWSVAE